jgi:hypothetical protein
VGGGVGGVDIPSDGAPTGGVPISPPGVGEPIPLPGAGGTGGSTTGVGVGAPMSPPGVTGGFVGGGVTGAPAPPVFVSSIKISLSFICSFFYKKTFDHFHNNNKFPNSKITMQPVSSQIRSYYYLNLGSRFGILVCRNIHQLTKRNIGITFSSSHCHLEKIKL